MNTIIEKFNNEGVKMGAWVDIVMASKIIGIEANSCERILMGATREGRCRIKWDGIVWFNIDDARRACEVFREAMNYEWEVDEDVFNDYDENDFEEIAF